MALFVIVFSLNMFDKMIETINNIKPIKKLYFFIMLVVFFGPNIRTAILYTYSLLFSHHQTKINTLPWSNF